MPSISSIIKWRKYKKEWRRKNADNYTIPVGYCNLNHVSIGKATYGNIKVDDNNINGSNLIIGNYCSIADGVVFLLNAEHNLHTVSTYPFKTRILGESGGEALSKGDIVVGDDVWIAHNAIILSGVTIGQGAVVAAGAVVTADVPPYSIVGGVPAKVLKYRFDEFTISELMKIDYSNLDFDRIKNHVEDLYTELNSPKQIGWMEKK